MKFRYTFEKEYLDPQRNRKVKMLTIEMLDTTMFIYYKYIRLGYVVTKREILIDGEYLKLI